MELSPNMTQHLMLTKLSLTRRVNDKSILTSDAQHLLDRFHKGDFKTISHQEGTKSVLIDFGEEIGRLLDETTGADLGATQFGSIKYGDEKVHITPQNVNR